jgi:hypothetical protein
MSSRGGAGRLLDGVGGGAGAVLVAALDSHKLDGAAKLGTGRGLGHARAAPANITPSGKLLWSKRFGDSTHEHILTTTADKDGNLVLSGTFRGMINFGGADMSANCAAQGDLFVVKLDPQGNHLCSKSFCMNGVVKSTASSW